MTNRDTIESVDGRLDYVRLYIEEEIERIDSVASGMFSSFDPRREEKQRGFKVIMLQRALREVSRNLGQAREELGDVILDFPLNGDPRAC